LSDAAFAVYKILLEIIVKNWGQFDCSSGSAAIATGGPTSLLGSSKAEP
jgi:LysR family nitrogen assimilation transcriptional regulator